MKNERERARVSNGMRFRNNHCVRQEIFGTEVKGQIFNAIHRGLVAMTAHTKKNAKTKPQKKTNLCRYKPSRQRHI